MYSTKNTFKIIFRYYIAKKHANFEGCCLPPPEKDDVRQRIDPTKLDNFLEFITSSHIVKDLPFGQKKIRTPKGKIIETPNIIRCMAPQAIIDQYQQNCMMNKVLWNRKKWYLIFKIFRKYKRFRDRDLDTFDWYKNEEFFYPSFYTENIHWIFYDNLGRSTIFRIVKNCTATIRKSLEGLDYYLAVGGRSFPDLIDIVQKLENDEERVKHLQYVWLAAKRYLKTDYKVIDLFFYVISFLRWQTDFSFHCTLLSALILLKWSVLNLHHLKFVLIRVMWFFLQCLYETLKNTFIHSLWLHPSLDFSAIIYVHDWFHIWICKHHGSCRFQSHQF